MKGMGDTMADTKLFNIKGTVKEYQSGTVTLEKELQTVIENNMNISETDRQLYEHRNSLVYRLKRFEKAIGLDIRKFDDAMTFKIAMMVIAHMNQ